MLNLRYFFVRGRPFTHVHNRVVHHTVSPNFSYDFQEKFGIDKKAPALSMVNDLLFVLAFFFARILGGSKDVSHL